MGKTNLEEFQESNQEQTENQIIEEEPVQGQTRDTLPENPKYREGIETYKRPSHPKCHWKCIQGCHYSKVPQ